MKTSLVLIRAALFVIVSLLIEIDAVAQLENRSSSRNKEQLTTSIDLTNAKRVEIKDGSGQIVLSGSFEERAAQLSGSGNAKGSAAIDIKSEGDTVKQSLETTVEGLPGATSFTLIVDGNDVGTFSTDRTGKRVLKFTRQ